MLAAAAAANGSVAHTTNKRKVQVQAPLATPIDGVQDAGDLSVAAAVASPRQALGPLRRQELKRRLQPWMAHQNVLASNKRVRLNTIPVSPTARTRSLYQLIIVSRKFHACMVGFFCCLLFGLQKGSGAENPDDCWAGCLLDASTGAHTHCTNPPQHFHYANIFCLLFLPIDAVCHCLI